MLEAMRKAAVVRALCRDYNICLAERPWDLADGNTDAARMPKKCNVLTQRAEVELLDLLHGSNRGSEDATANHHHAQ